MKKPNVKKEKRRLIVPIALFFIGAAFFIAGLFDGETETVLMKAVYVCLECIGLG